MNINKIFIIILFMILIIMVLLIMNNEEAQSIIQVNMLDDVFTISDN